jgi:DNA replication and repair protein RecF
MPLIQLEISNFRNIKRLSLKPASSGFTVICGLNGSGKTSLLEAIHVLSCGRSFRTSDANQLIQKSTDECIVHGKISAVDGAVSTFGVARRPGSTLRSRRAGLPSKLIDHAKEFPVRVISPVESNDLINAGPSKRRDFVDWGVFHVKHCHWDVLKDFNRIVKQRNAALKMKCAVAELHEWNSQFVAASLGVDAARREFYQLWWQHFKGLVEHVPLLACVKAEYLPGWDSSCLLADVLAEAMPKERVVGHGLHGPHRAELLLTVDGVAVKESFSRGQQKLLAVAMYLSQGAALFSVLGKHPLYMVDDFTSELDEHSQALLLSVLCDVEKQVIVTSLDKNPLLSLLKSHAISFECCEINSGSLHQSSVDVTA